MESVVERMSPEKAMKILNDQSIEVSLEQAALILAFLRQMAGIVVESNLKNTG